MKPPSQALAIVNLFCYGKVVETKLGGRNAPWVVCALVLWPTLAAAHDLRCQRTEFDVSRQYIRVFDAAGRRFMVDPDLGRAVTLVESNFDPGAVSPKGAVGLMQLMPDTISQLRVRDPFDPIQSIYGGMEYLHWLADSSRFAGNPYMVLVAYNAGPNRAVIPESSYHYADLITSIYWQLKDHQGRRGPILFRFLAPPVCHQQTQHPLTLADLRWQDGKILPSMNYNLVQDRKIELFRRERKLDMLSVRKPHRIVR